MTEMWKYKKKSFLTSCCSRINEKKKLNCPRTVVVKPTLYSSAFNAITYMVTVEIESLFGKGHQLPVDVQLYTANYAYGISTANCFYAQRFLKLARFCHWIFFDPNFMPDQKKFTPASKKCHTKIKKFCHLIVYDCVTWPDITLQQKLLI